MGHQVYLVEVPFQRWNQKNSEQILVSRQPLELPFLCKTLMDPTNKLYHAITDSSKMCSNIIVTLL